MGHLILLHFYLHLESWTDIDIDVFGTDVQQHQSISTFSKQYIVLLNKIDNKSENI